MRHLLLSFFLLALSTVGMGQINLREGIVITLQGDTLHGDIDYRTDEMNAKNCLFRKDGTTDFVNYTPGKIKGYRFLENGRYYVSKTTPEGKLLFLEFVVRGQLNLYYQGSTIHNNVYYLENEKGELVQFVEQDLNTDKTVRRKNLYKALAMTEKSESTQKMLWTSKLNRYNATKAVVNYNHEVCPDGDCEILQYKSKETPKSDQTTHLVVLGGLLNYQWALSNHIELISSRPYHKGWNVGVGVETYLPRINPGLYGEGYISYNRVNFKETGLYRWTLSREIIDYDLKINEIAARAGLGYQWIDLPVQPRVHAGYAMAFYKGHGKLSNQKVKQDIAQMDCGFYAGAGLSYPLKKGALLLDVVFYHTQNTDRSHRTNNAWKQLNIQRLSYTIGYQF